MTQDFAKHRRQPPEPTGSQSRSVLFWFAGGFLSGAFVTTLIALWYLNPSPEPPTASAGQPTAAPKAKADEMQWDFYEIFPRSVVPVVEEYTGEGEKVVVDDRPWVLQAGAFKDPNDADERRAELLLMGLPAATSIVDKDGTRWHRIIVGPFDTELEKNRALDILAQAQIQSIPKRIPRA